MMSILPDNEVLKYNGEILYPVDKIIDRRRGSNGRVEYLVHWKGFTNENDTWEPAKSLRETCPSLVREFMEYNKIQDSASSITEVNNNTPICGSSKGLDISNGISKPSLDVKASTNCSSLSNRLSFLSDIKQQNKIQQNSLNKIKDLSQSAKLFKCNGFINDTSNENVENQLLHVSHDKASLTDNELYDSNLKGNSSNNTVSWPSGSFTSNNSTPIRNNSISNSLPNPPLNQPNLPIKRKSEINIPLVDKRQKFGAIHQMNCVQNKSLTELNRAVSVQRENVNRNLFSTFSNEISVDKIKQKLQNLPYKKHKEAENPDTSELMSRRTSARQQEAANRFKEIIVRKNYNAGLTEIVLHKRSQSFPNSFTNKVLDELTMCLNQARSDNTKVILLTASGPIFSSGMDLRLLLSNKPYGEYGSRINNVKTVPHSLSSSTIQLAASPSHANMLHLIAESLQKFLMALLHFPKPVVVGINGSAMGLGCAILPLCDLIYASESASFVMPYTMLNQIPEAGASTTFPLLFGFPLANQLLLTNRKISAKEALNRGLISEILFSEKFSAELLIRCSKLCSVPSQSLERMKCIIRAQHYDRIERIIRLECDQLVESWKSVEFQESAEKFIEKYLPYILL